LAMASIGLVIGVRSMTSGKVESDCLWIDIGMVPSVGRKEAG
jgi:hypothetical protein